MKSYKTVKVDSEIYLPRTSEQFDDLVSRLCRTYKVSDMDRATAVVAQRIQHLPPDQATTTLKYLGHSILKNIAYGIAHDKASQLNHKIQIDTAFNAWLSDQNNQQARDAVEKAANSGSIYAKDRLADILKEEYEDQDKKNGPTLVNLSGSGTTN